MFAFCRLCTCIIPHIILSPCRDNSIPFPVWISYIYFRFWVNCSVTFDLINHKVFSCKLEIYDPKLNFLSIQVFFGKIQTINYLSLSETLLFLTFGLNCFPKPRINCMTKLLVLEGVWKTSKTCQLNFWAQFCKRWFP